MIRQKRRLRSSRSSCRCKPLYVVESGYLRVWGVEALKKISAAVVIIWIALLLCLLRKDFPGRVYIWTAFSVVSLLTALVLVNLFLDMHKK